jgi:RecA-family ATPase
LGTTTICAGNPGDGKSMLSLDIAARVSRGAEWPDDSGSAPIGSVVILAAEDDIATTMRPRLEAAGADLTKIHCVQAVERICAVTGKRIPRSVRLDFDLDRIVELARKLGDVRLVIIDPISEYLGAVNSHRDAELRGLLSPLSTAAATGHFAVLNILHLNKGNKDGPAMYRAMGSIAFVAQARVAWCHVRDANDPERVLWLPLKNNLHKRVPGLAYKIVEPGRIEWQDGAVETTADEAMQNAAGRNRTGTR